jgi:curli biogenesis system outer membrane secretion channel CsgG
MRNKIIVLCLIGLMLGLVFSPAEAQLKKRVAVFTFEDKTDHNWHWWDGKHPGDGMADMLTTTLVKSGKYVVMERQEITRILDEQKMGQTGMVTPQSAAEVGKLLGVELAIMGAVTEFGYTKSDKGGRLKGISVGVKSQKATVAVDVRMVNTSTGEILAAETVRKEKSSSGLSLSTPQVGFRDQNSFDNSLVGKVTRESIDAIVGLIDSQMEQVPWGGKIILVQGTSVFMKPGSDAGVKVGDQFTVYKEGQKLVDPDTGLELGSVEEKVGTIEVQQIVANGKAAKCVIKMGSGMDKGDIIRLK